MMLDQVFSIHQEAREGHEERRTGLENRSNFNMFFLCLRALRVLRGGLHRINYQQRETLHRYSNYGKVIAGASSVPMTQRQIPQVDSQRLRNTTMPKVVMTAPEIL